METENAQLPILSIDAWRNPEGGWDWNDISNTGDFVPFNAIDWTTRALLRHIRDIGLLNNRSKGRVQVVDTGNELEIQARGTGEPLFAIQYGQYV